MTRPAEEVARIPSELVGVTELVAAVGDYSFRLFVVAPACMMEPEHWRVVESSVVSPCWWPRIAFDGDLDAAIVVLGLASVAVTAAEISEDADVAVEHI